MSLYFGLYGDIMLVTCGETKKTCSMNKKQAL